jgi:hypothetical protein
VHLCRVRPSLYVPRKPLSPPLRRVKDLARPKDDEGGWIRDCEMEVAVSQSQSPVNAKCGEFPRVHVHRHAKPSATLACAGNGERWKPPPLHIDHDYEQQPLPLLCIVPSLPSSSLSIVFIVL